jgi:hypothetical protein
MIKNKKPVENGLDFCTNSYYYMSKLKRVIIQVREYDGTVVEVEIDNNFINFYKKETGRSKISAKSLSKFINHLVESHIS